MDALSSLLGGESLKDVFSKTISGWLGDIITSAFQQFDQLMVKLLDCVFHIENIVVSGTTTVLTEQSIQSAYHFIYVFVCSVVVLKFLFKGFQIYILWRDGDADASPRDMVIGVAEAAAVMSCFPFLYDKCVDIFLYLARGIMGKLGISEGLSIPAIVGTVTSAGIFIIITVLIYAIMVFLLWISLIKRGVELLVLRLGVPIAALGLLDSDMGLWKGYVQIFIKTAFTSVIQVSLMSLAFRIAGTFQFLNVLVGIAFISAALSTPLIMQQLLVASHSSNMSQKMYSAGMAIRALKSLTAA